MSENLDYEYRNSTFVRNLSLSIDSYIIDTFGKKIPSDCYIKLADLIVSNSSVQQKMDIVLHEDIQAMLKFIKEERPVWVEKELKG